MNYDLWFSKLNYASPLPTAPACLINLGSIRVRVYEVMASQHEIHVILVGLGPLIDYYWQPVKCKCDQNSVHQDRYSR